MPPFAGFSSQNGRPTGAWSVIIFPAWNAMSPARDREARSRDRDPRGPIQARQGFFNELQVPRTSPERSWGVPRFRLHRQTCCRAIRESRAGRISSSSLLVSRGRKIASCRRSSLVHVCENSLDVFVVFEFIEEFFDFTHLFFGVILGIVGNALRARFHDFDPQFLNR